MNIETKFNLDDSVWYMKDNKPVNVIVSAINIFKVGTDQDSIKYHARDTTNSVSWLDHSHLHEGVLFNSKSELVDELFNMKVTCKGIDLGDGNFSGCNQSGGDCPSCGK